MQRYTQGQKQKTITIKRPLTKQPEANQSEDAWHLTRNSLRRNTGTQSHRQSVIAQKKPCVLNCTGGYRRNPGNQLSPHNIKLTNLENTFDA